MDDAVIELPALRYEIPPLAFRAHQQEFAHCQADWLDRPLPNAFPMPLRAAGKAGRRAGQIGHLDILHAHGSSEVRRFHRSMASNLLTTIGLELLLALGFKMGV